MQERRRQLARLLLTTSSQAEKKSNITRHAYHNDINHINITVVRRANGGTGVDGLVEARENVDVLR